MKMKLTFAVAALAMVSHASAATYLVSNVVTGDGTADGLYQNADGSLLNGGIVALGYFTGGAPSTSLSDIATTIASFSLQASALAGSPSASLGGSFPGYVEGELVQGAIITAPSTLIGQPMYIFAGNAATLETSTEWALAVLRPIQDDVPFEQQYNANPFGTVPYGEIGTIGTFTGNASGFGESTYTTLQLAPIPEPSAALLGALGALGLLRRRRI